MSVGAIDLGILLAYMAGVVALGLWTGRGARDMSEYVVGGRDVAWWLILFSIIAGRWLTSSVVASVLGIAAFTTGIVLGVYFLGLLTRRVGQRAALAGLLLGLAGMTWIYFATSLAWSWYALVGSLLTAGAGLAASRCGNRSSAG